MKTTRKVRTAVIGCGGIANSVHLPALSSMKPVELVAVCDIVEERARNAAKKYNVPAVYTLYADMLKREKIDAVYVLTEPDQLFRPTTVCLEAGKHVFMEKPPGISTFEAESLLRAARSARRILSVGLNRRHIPLVQEVLRLMKKHTKITQVEGRFNKHTSASFCLGAISAFPADTIHAIDLVRWIAGGTPVAAAMVESHRDDIVPNAWNAVARFDNGVTGIIRANYMTGGRVHSLEIHGPGASAFVNLGFGDASCDAEIILSGGAKGYSLAATGAAEKNQVSLDGRKVAGSDAFYAYYGYLRESEDFINCVLKGKRPLTDIEEAVKTMRFIDYLLKNRI
jgi:predicted dehydrogenase